MNLPRLCQPRLSRRRALAGASMFALTGLGLSLSMPARSATSDSPVPSALKTLDNAAMALFDAAETSQWDAATRALDQAATAANAITTVQPAFIDAGGTAERFYQARNTLAGDLNEARIALGAKDGRWLLSTADRIASRAGELSEPFLRQSGALVPRIEALLFLARQMRRALAWHDEAGFRNADDDFNRLWPALRTALGSQSASRLQGLDNAVAHLANDGSVANAKALDLAVRSLRASMT